MFMSQTKRIFKNLNYLYLTLAKSMIKINSVPFKSLYVKNSTLAKTNSSIVQLATR
jgi:hypothetical protein